MATTKLILTHDVPNLGHAGEVVEVKAGYARNYLVPRGFAAKWTAGAQKQIDQIAAARRRHEIATIDDARAVRDALQGAVVEISGKVGNSGRLFGAVSAAAIADALLGLSFGDILLSFGDIFLSFGDILLNDSMIWTPGISPL